MIPTRQDQDLAALDDAHALVLIRCRSFIHTGQRRDPAAIREALRAYVDKVTDFVNGEQ